MCSRLSRLQQGNATMADRLLVLVPHEHTQVNSKRLLMQNIAEAEACCSKICCDTTSRHLCCKQLQALAAPFDLLAGLLHWSMTITELSKGGQRQLQ